jgi:predicted Zn-dependent protease
MLLDVALRYAAVSREGKVEEAMALQKRAMQLDSSNLHLRLGMAKLLLASGDKQAARRQLQAIAAQGEGFVRQAEVRALFATLCAGVSASGRE